MYTSEAIWLVGCSPLSLASITFHCLYSTAMDLLRPDVSAMSDSDVGDQQMLITVLTNFQKFVDVPFISTCGRYPVHERFPLSSCLVTSSSFYRASACRARYCYAKSVRLSVCPSVRPSVTLVLYINDCRTLSTVW